MPTIYEPYRIESMQLRIERVRVTAKDGSTFETEIMKSKTHSLTQESLFHLEDYSDMKIEVWPKLVVRFERGRHERNESGKYRLPSKVIHSKRKLYEVDEWTFRGLVDLAWQENYKADEKALFGLTKPIYNWSEELVSEMEEEALKVIHFMVHNASVKFKDGNNCFKDGEVVIPSMRIDKKKMSKVQLEEMERHMYFFTYEEKQKFLKALSRLKEEVMSDDLVRAIAANKGKEAVELIESEVQDNDKEGTLS